MAKPLDCAFRIAFFIDYGDFTVETQNGPSIPMPELPLYNIVFQECQY